MKISKTGVYKKKPVTISALKTDANGEIELLKVTELSMGVADILVGMHNGRINRVKRGDGKTIWEIHTEEGIVTASPGDWIVRGVKGEFYPVKPDIFEMTYDCVGVED